MIAFILLKVNSATFPLRPYFSPADMEQMHVTMDESSTEPSSAKTPRILKDDTHMLRGVHIPNHMLSPGQDGYRTPTIEDYEVHSYGPTIANSTKAPTEVATSSSVHHWSPHSHYHLNIHSISHVHILDHLHWRERIRHFTWTYFAINMATGGIANVLYTGKLRDARSLSES